MILIPNIATTIFIDGDRYCSVAGHPLQIAKAILVDEIKIDSIVSLITPRYKEISIYENGSMAYAIYEDFCKSYHIKFNKISEVHPKKFFQEGIWNG